MNAQVAALRRRVSGSEDGFTITELAAAMAILLLALIGLARTATVAFSDVSNARQRQTGNQLANQLLEEVRGLPFETVENGLSSSDLGGDADIKSCGGDTYRYLSCTTGEEIVHSAGLTNVSPLVPHTGSVGPPEYPGTYAWRVYVTEAADAPSAGAYRVRVIVDWVGAGRGGARSEVDAQTLVYHPDGCVDDASHPFAAPCESYFYGTGVAGGGSFTISGFFEGANFDSMTGAFVAESADAQIEQVSLVQGNVTLPEISRTANGVRTAEPSGASSSADDDPSTPSGTYDRQPVGPQRPGWLRVQDGPDKLDLRLDGGAQGSTISTTAAGGANECNLQIDGRPCGVASATESGAMSLVGTLKDGGTATLVSVGTSSTPVTTYVRRAVPVAGQDGLVREEIAWNLPDIQVGGLPSDIGAPSGWQGYWVRLRDFSATAVAEAGTNTSAPAVSIAGGTIESWKGNGYTATPVAASGTTPRTGPEDFAVPINSLVQQTTVRGKKLRVELSGTVTIKPSTVRSTVTEGSTRSEAEATIGSPLVVDLRYVVQVNGVTEVDVGIVVTAGQGRATASYRPAPTG